MIATAFKPNTLVSYHGGGYDGCIFEYNYAYFDANGEFHDVYSSGVMGCQTVEKLQEKRSEELDSYDLTSEEDRRTFADRESIVGVVQCAEWFFKNFPEVKFLLQCKDCGKRFNVVDGHGDDYRGVGGVEYHAHSIICPDCWNANCCSCCNEHFGAEHQFVETEHYSHACEYCAMEDTPV